jgi:hypothetical protein
MVVSKLYFMVFSSLEMIIETTLSSMPKCVTQLHAMYSSLGFTIYVSIVNVLKYSTVKKIVF